MKFLPATMVRGQALDVIVRRITTRRREPIIVHVAEHQRARSVGHAVAR